jgi:3-oxoacyl-[acyl-carrier-protein] synthase III
LIRGSIGGSTCPRSVLQKYGYTGSVYIPMALDDAIELGKI